MIPDPELVVRKYLHDHADVSALVDKIGTRTPQTTELPWLRITLIGITPRSTPLYFIEALMQVECYAGADNSQGTASTLARTVLQALDEMDDQLHEDAVVTFTRSSMRRMPDDSFEPGRERYVVQTAIGLHAVPAAA